MGWYLIHTKPRQEQCALQNLERQGFACYLPELTVEKLRSGVVVLVTEPLFPRYLFIELESGVSSRSWSPIRSTRGVSRLVSFGTEPARVPDALVQALRTSAQTRTAPRALFDAGERVKLVDGPFAGIEGVYEMLDGDRRAMVLIEMMSKRIHIHVDPGVVRRAG